MYGGCLLFHHEECQFLESTTIYKYQVQYCKGTVQYNFWHLRASPLRSWLTNILLTLVGFLHSQCNVVSTIKLLFCSLTFHVSAIKRFRLHHKFVYFSLNVHIRGIGDVNDYFLCCHS